MELKITTDVGTLTGIFVQDWLTPGYSGYFKEYDNIIAEGNNIHETIDNLIELLYAVLEHESKSIL